MKRSEEDVGYWWRALKVDEGNEVKMVWSCKT